MIDRRHFLGAAGAAGAAGLLGGLSLPGRATGDDYRALIVIHLNGGNDG
ncbi:MAG: twin-arginine translocation signal domain-containing protein, partial [Burkholderiales bacterium]|nr:twin-arginine translocation signal domain-containing protein [Burkholderiales bacterium]